MLNKLQGRSPRILLKKQNSERLQGKERDEERNQLISCHESKTINPTDLDNSFLPLQTLRPAVQKFSVASCSTFAPSVVLLGGHLVPIFIRPRQNSALLRGRLHKDSAIVLDCIEFLSV
jgi:hypothetical protein